MNLTSFIEHGHRRYLDYVLYAVGGGTLILALVWSCQLILAGKQSSEIATSIKNEQEQVEKARQEISSTPVAAPETNSVPSADNAIGYIRTLAVNCARANDIKLEEFSAPPALVQFQTVYGTPVDAAGFQQAHVQMTLNGDLPRVLQTLNVLAASKLPFEWVSLDLAPQAPADQKFTASDNVSARVEMNVLARGGSS